MPFLNSILANRLAFGRQPHQLAWQTALWIALVCNWPLWQALAALPEMSSVRGGLFGLAFAGMIAAITTMVMVIFAWRASVRIVLSVFVIVAAVGAHFMGTYGTVIDSTMMVNVLLTDAREVRDLVNLPMIASLSLMLIPPLWWLWRRPPETLGLWRQGGKNLLTWAVALVCVIALLLLTFADMSATMRNHKSLRYRINPLNTFYALAMVAVEAHATPDGAPTPIGQSATLTPPTQPTAKPPLLLLVVGETARSDHFSLNGYPRPTNPQLQARDVVSFTNVTSCGTNTAASLPCMFSPLGRSAFVNSNKNQENLLDLVQHMGMGILWIDNQAGGCKGVCNRVPSVRPFQLAPGAPPIPEGLCDGEECFDAALLHGLDARINALSAEQKARGVLIVLHQMGSHGPAYYMRSPAHHKPFTPECTTNVLQQCESEALINAYDNSIAYTDHVVAQGIDWLAQQTAHFDPALIYLSDHGESLGENNLYLHGLPYAIAPRQQTHVPWIAWWPAQTAAAQQVPLSCLHQRRTEPLSHDHLFHTVTRWLGIQTPEYRDEWDAFRACRTSASP